MASWIGMSDSIRVRGFRRADLDAVLSIATGAFDEYGAGSREHVARMLDRRGSYSWVATVTLSVAGFAILSTTGVPSLDAIAVATRHRGRGVGQQLLEAVMKDVRARGLPELRLVTAQSNVAALSLFNRCGFQLVQRKRRFYAAGQDAVVLSRFLSSYT